MRNRCSYFAGQPVHVVATLSRSTVTLPVDDDAPAISQNRGAGYVERRLTGTQIMRQHLETNPATHCSSFYRIDAWSDLYLFSITLRRPIQALNTGTYEADPSKAP